MVVTEASQHSVSSETEYCTSAQVLLLLKGVAQDVAGTTLAAWLSSEERQDLIELFLPDARARIDAWAGRDFYHHEDVDVVVDGNDLDVLDISLYGFVPLLSLSNLAISGSDQSTDDYVVYRDGRIKAKKDALGTYRSVAKASYFLRGTQNVAMTVSWGYETVPADISLAQARKAAAEVLATLESADSESGTVPGSTQRVQYGDLRITMGSEGRFNHAISLLESKAKAAAMHYRIPHASGPQPDRVGVWA